MKIGIYAPYLNTCGGGERYICKIAEILSSKNRVELITPQKINIKKLEEILNVNLNKINIVNLHCLFSLVKPLFYLLRIYAALTLSKITKKYDLFINQDRSLIIPSFAKKSIFICEVPLVHSHNLIVDCKNFFKNLFLDHKLKTYNKIIVNSFFTKRYVKDYYNKKAEVLYPPIDIEESLTFSKQNIILNAGRFFTGGHCKKQLEMIKIFKQLYQEDDKLKNWEFHLAGKVDENEKHQKYFEICQREARNCPIHFHTRLSAKQLKELYKKTKIYWHATGLGEDKKTHPEKMEHFGIATAEAISAGCVPVVINKGGQPEIVIHKINGFLYNSPEELKKYTLELIYNENLWKKMSKKSIERSKIFGMERFKTEVEEIFLNL